MWKQAVPIILLAFAMQAEAQRKGGGRPDPGGHGPGGPRLVAASVGAPDELVKNAPYSAEVITESTQPLADGNHIRQSSSVKVWRDSEGRVRREQSLRSLGGLAPEANLPPVVFISDPVAKATYALNPKDRTATKAGLPPARRPHAEGAPPMQGPPPRGGRRGEGGKAAGENAKTESLGRRVVEGIPADGTRTVLTIPAGRIGNDQPIQVVSETWYSPELHTVVLAKRTDPRFGETVTRLANVSRGEPPTSLFTVPADFKMSDAPRNMRLSDGPGKR
jgi:hypothetical protein